MAGRPDISIVIPAYNEESNIEKCFLRVITVLEKYNESFEVILEEDGSTDRTPEIIDTIAKKYTNVHVFHSCKREGKGFGIKKCIDIAQGEKIVFIDSDMEYSPDSLPEMLKKIGLYDIVIGSRNITKGRKRYRVILTKLHSLVLKIFFRINLQDSQSGLKVLKRKVIDEVKPLRSNGFEIDSEILIKAIRKGFKIGYVQVPYSYKGNSTVNLFSDPFKMFLLLLKLRVRMN